MLFMERQYIAHFMKHQTGKTIEQFKGIPGDPVFILFWEEISACSAVHTRCYGRVRSCAIHNSFASYDGDVICACRINKVDCQ